MCFGTHYHACYTNKIPTFSINTVFLTKSYQNHITENYLEFFALMRINKTQVRTSRIVNRNNGENVLERKWLNDRAVNETFATSVRRALWSSKGGEFLQRYCDHDPEDCSERGDTARRAVACLLACLPVCLPTYLLTRGCTFTSLPVLRHPCVQLWTSSEQGRLSLISPWLRLSILSLPMLIHIFLFSPRLLF